MARTARLGINVDHIATVRQARNEGFPDPVEAARAAIKAGADGITAHLREDRRHIQDQDLWRLRRRAGAPLNMEMAATDELVAIAERVRPAWACLVPEKRRELTTEGGLDLRRARANVARAIKRLHRKGVKISLFVEPDVPTIEAARELGADAVELHTGRYARLFRRNRAASRAELRRIRRAANAAMDAGLIVNAGHGIDYENVGPLMKTFRFHELNIGFSVVSRALSVGLGQAVKEMKRKMK